MRDVRVSLPLARLGRFGGAAVRSICENQGETRRSLTVPSSTSTEATLSATWTDLRPPPRFWRGFGGGRLGVGVALDPLALTGSSRLMLDMIGRSDVADADLVRFTETLERDQSRANITEHPTHLSSSVLFRFLLLPNSASPSSSGSSLALTGV